MNQPIQALDNPIMLFDGASVSDPGAAAAAAVLLLPNGRRYTVSQFLGRGTEIEAEYTGLLIGLKKARQLGIKELEVKGDCELVFRQINGSEAIGDPDLQTLCQETRTLLISFDRVRLECIPREQNRSAVAAVNRCIGEALGKERKVSPNLSPSQALAPDIARLIQLGKKATERDFQTLEVRLDELAGKTLAQLQALVPETERDAIALQWDGDDDHLAEIYRWYCRGLPAPLALKKVMLETPRVEETEEKLPWEGELFGSTAPEMSIETSDPFVSSPLLEPIADPSALSSPPSLPPSSEATPAAFLPISERDTLLSFPDRHVAAKEDEKPMLPDSITDPSKDTLPSMAKARHVQEIMGTLSREEREFLIQHIVQSPEWVNLFFQALAERVADR
ncbi:ribonuclease HI family protein [Pannus brasiliensis CCIBt3594]|uniref:Ribonuclease HI family protein n=1 Tax=Pannus brasiliensis CCIBt3594 TaxID=1427578 RepID=A0AAW9QU53_9CHRO